MFEQASLAGFDVECKRTDRLFFALVPDPDTAARIARLAHRLRREHGLKGRVIATERFHVTLHHLGDHAGLPEDLIATARTAAASVAMPPFEVVFDRVGSFSRKLGNRPLVLRGDDGVVALKTFQQALGLAMTKAGLGRWAESQYTPHVTLLYDDRAVDEQIVETIVWTAREFILMHSLLGRTRHVPLARWPLENA